MRKFKHKKTGAIYNVSTQSVVDSFLKKPEFIEIKKEKIMLKENQKNLNSKEDS